MLKSDHVLDQPSIEITEELVVMCDCNVIFRFFEGKVE